MLFSEVVHYFDQISQHSSRIEITKLLAELYKKANPEEARFISYLALGTLRPAHEGVKFNYAEKNIVKVLASLLEQDPAHVTLQIKQVGDIGLYIRSQKWHEVNQPITVHGVYTQLCALENISGTGSQEEKARMLKELLEQLDALSASYIVSIIIGTMRLGFSDMTILDSLSWMIAGNKSLHNTIENGYNLCADIGLIACTLKQSGIEAVSQIKPILGIPIRPAAAERLPSAEAIIEKLGPCVAQPKLDGFRLQIHVKKSDSKPEIWFFSRNLQDMSYMFPDLFEAFAQFNVETVIIEGEAIVFDEDTGQFLPFQETVKRKRKHNIEEVAESLPLRLYLFDILFLNNRSLLDLTHTERREQLEKLIQNNSHTRTIQAIEEKYTPTTEALEHYFNEQITRGLEGLVVKRPDSIYQPGKRNFNWIKLKRHSAGHLDDTIDCVVLGYYFGRGKRSQFGIGAFLVGVYNPDRDCFESIAKVGTGLKDTDWVDLKSRLDNIHLPDKPHNVDCAPELAPDIWVAPEVTVVILADEVTQSPLHAAARGSGKLGLALRFPRFMGYSIDKQATQATTSHEIRELFDMQYGRT